MAILEMANPRLTYISHVSTSVALSPRGSYVPCMKAGVLTAQGVEHLRSEVVDAEVAQHLRSGAAEATRHGTVSIVVCPLEGELE